MGFEENIKKSFSSVKTDMISIKNQILTLAESQQDIREKLVKLEQLIKKLSTKKVVKKK